MRVTLIAKELRRAPCPIRLSPATEAHTAASQRGPQDDPTAAPGAPKSGSWGVVASACASWELPPRRPRQSPGGVGPRPRVCPLPAPQSSGVLAAQPSTPDSSQESRPQLTWDDPARKATCRTTARQVAPKVRRRRSRRRAHLRPVSCARHAASAALRTHRAAAHGAALAAPRPAVPAAPAAAPDGDSVALQATSPGARL